MANEALISRLSSLISEITRLGGRLERTAIVPNIEVINAAPTNLPAGYITIRNPRDGTSVPALTVPGVLYANGDLVNVLFVEGSEPIAMQQGSASSGGTAPSILTTKGSLITHDSVSPIEFFVGTDDQVLIADSTQASGLRWGSIISVGVRTSFIDGLLVVTTNVGPAHIIHTALSVELVYIHCKTPGSAGSTIVDVNLNGTTIFTTQANRPTLLFSDADQIAVSGTPNISNIVTVPAVLTCDIDQIATGAADLSILIVLGVATSVVPPPPPPAAGVDVIEANFHGGWLESHWTFGGPDEAASLDEILYFDGS
jgi:hypothetical protein